jgi:hypothetical protein
MIQAASQCIMLSPWASAQVLRTNPADPLRYVVDGFTQPRVRLQQLQRAKTTIAQSGQMELAHLKRLYKAQGFSEADIHRVFPNRPRLKKATVSPPSPTPAGPTLAVPELAL